MCTCSFLLEIVGELQNELDLSSYSLTSKTSRYAHFGRNRITGYGHPKFRLMLPYSHNFEFLNIRIAALSHPEFRLRSVAYCPTTGLPFNQIW